MVSELKTRNRQIKEKKLLGKDEVYHGALEDILLGECSLNHPQLASKAHNYIPQWPTSYQNRPQWPTVSLKGPKKASMSLVGFSGLKQDIMDLKWPQLIKALNSFRLCYTFSRYLPS